MNGLLIGKLLKPSGLKGYLRAAFYVNDLEDLEAFSAFYVKDKKAPGGFKTLHVEKVFEQSGGLAVIIEDCKDRTAAEALQGLEIFVNEEELPPAGKNEFYIRDLMGIEVWMNGELFGTIDNIVEIANRTMLVLALPGDKHLMAPFSGEYFGDVDLAAKRIEAFRLNELL